MSKIQAEFIYDRNEYPEIYIEKCFAKLEVKDLDFIHRITKDGRKKELEKVIFINFNYTDVFFK